MFIDNPFGGLKLVEVRPIPTYKRLKRLGKSKIGKRWVTVRSFNGYTHTVAKGRPLMDSINKVVYLHPHDYQKVRNEVALKAAKAHAVPVSHPETKKQAKSLFGFFGRTLTKLGF